MQNPFTSGTDSFPVATSRVLVCTRGVDIQYVLRWHLLELLGIVIFKQLLYWHHKCYDGGQTEP